MTRIPGRQWTQDARSAYRHAVDLARADGRPLGPEHVLACLGEINGEAGDRLRRLGVTEETVLATRDEQDRKSLAALGIATVDQYRAQVQPRRRRSLLVTALEQGQLGLPDDVSLWRKRLVVAAFVPFGILLGVAARLRGNRTPFTELIGRAYQRATDQVTSFDLLAAMLSFPNRGREILDDLGAAEPLKGEH